MSRTACISALVNTLGTATAFGSSAHGTVVSYDDRAVVSGVDRAIVVEHIRGEAKPRFFAWDWYLAATLFVRINNDPHAARATASVLVQTAMDTIRANRDLGGSVIEAEPIANRMVNEGLRFARGTFYVETITVKVTEAV